MGSWISFFLCSRLFTAEVGGQDNITLSLRLRDKKVGLKNYEVLHDKISSNSIFILPSGSSFPSLVSQLYPRGVRGTRLGPARASRLAELLEPKRWGPDH